MTPRSAIVVALLVAACAALGCRATPDPGAERAYPNPAATPLDEASPLDFVEIRDGAPSAGGTPVVLAIHGLGGRPEELADLFRAVRGPRSLVLPRAPIPWGEGSSWFDIDIPYAPSAALGERIGAAADRVVALLGHLERTRALAGKPVVTGFSQGGMISFAIAARHPGAVAAAAPIAGALPAAALPPGPVSGPKPRILAFHGAADDLVPVDEARRTVAAFAAAGYDAALREYPGVDHAISGEMGRDVVEFLSAAIGR